MNTLVALVLSASLWLVGVQDALLQWRPNGGLLFETIAYCPVGEEDLALAYAYSYREHGDLDRTDAGWIAVYGVLYDGEQKPLVVFELQDETEDAWLIWHLDMDLDGYADLEGSGIESLVRIAPDFCALLNLLVEKGSMDLQKLRLPWNGRSHGGPGRLQELVLSGRGYPGVGLA